MTHRLAAALAAAVLVSGCGSDEIAAPPLPDGAVQPGSARIVVGDDDTGTTWAVDCATDAAGTLRVSIGTQSSGATAVVDQADDMAVRTVTLTGLGGFTGSYLEGVGEGTAEATTIGNTYSITGTARGFDDDSPSFTSDADFDIAVSCV